MQHPQHTISVTDAESLITFTDWAKFNSSQLARTLGHRFMVPKKGKLRRQAQLNIQEATRRPLDAVCGLSWNTQELSSTAEDRLVELFQMRAAEVRSVAVMQGLLSAADAEIHPMHHLIKLIFVHEFTVTRAAAAAAAAADPGPLHLVGKPELGALRREVKRLANLVSRERQHMGFLYHNLEEVLGRIERELRLD